MKPPTSPPHLSQFHTSPPASYYQLKPEYGADEKKCGLQTLD